VGSAPHFGAAYFSQIAGVEMVHVPFKGGSPRLRALAVTQRERSSLMPEIPGMAEAGVPDYAIAFWYGLFVPVGTPPDVIRKLFDATIAAAKEPAVKAALAREGTEVELSRSPQEFAAFLAEDSKFWIKLAKESGATAD
jgi:tripartite-type tricarboxylate transporter receptor subunit TctC